MDRMCSACRHQYGRQTIANMKLTGVVLAGGKSIRMGSEKGLILFKGKAMIQYSIELLEKITDTILISSSLPEYSAFKQALVPDTVPNIGPIGGIHACLSRMNTKFAFFIPCDMPMASIKMANRLINASPGFDIAVPRSLNQEVHPLFGVYSKDLLPLIQLQINAGDYKLKNLLNKAKTYYLDYSLDEENYLNNINRPEDVRQ